MTLGELLVLKEEMLAILSEEQKKRGADSSWILRELEVMTDAVNIVRVQRDLPPITIEDLQRRERLAQGHSDYSSKVALYCAELALGLPDRGP